jgi:hypothetical protein
MRIRERSVAFMPLHKIDRVDIDVYRNGRGTLTFHGSPEGDGKSWNVPYVVNNATTVNGFPLFEQIENPKQVYDMVLEAQEDVWARQPGNRQRGGSP